MKLGSRNFIIVIGVLALLLALLKGSTKKEVVVVDQGPQYVPGPVRPVFIRPWGRGGHHGGHGGGHHGGHGGGHGGHHPKPPKIPKIPKIPIKPPKIPVVPKIPKIPVVPKIPLPPPKSPPEPFMNNLRPPAPTIPVQSQRWF